MVEKMKTIISIHQHQLNQLKTAIAEARRELEQTWAIRGNTDPEVLAAGEIFDRLMNEYDRLIKI
jgi:hypothetical protein